MKTCKAVAVEPGTANSARFVEDLPVESPDDFKDGDWIRLRPIVVGLDGTDKEIGEALYGTAPPGQPLLVPGHEVLAQVIEVGPNARKLGIGDFVAVEVRLPLDCVYGQTARQHMQRDEHYVEHGICEAHGFLREEAVVGESECVKVPRSMANHHVLVEPMAIWLKAYRQGTTVLAAHDGLLRPNRFLVTGAGALSNLAAADLLTRGKEVVVLARRGGDNPRANLVRSTGAKYLASEDYTREAHGRSQQVGREVSTAEAAILSEMETHGAFDFVFEASGSRQLAMIASLALGGNGICVASSITGGNGVETVPAAELNQRRVLLNQLHMGAVNADKMDYVEAVRSWAVIEDFIPGFIPAWMDCRIDGLKNFATAYHRLAKDRNVLKVHVVVQQPI